jgi:inner membrane protein
MDAKVRFNNNGLTLKPVDSLTHIVAGAAIAELMIGKKAGNRALFWGALAGSAPDIDAAFVPFYNTVVDEMVYHRGFTHSIVFSLLISALTGFGLYKLYPKLSISSLQWGLMFFVNMIVHILLDCFTTWGTQVFWPHPARVEIKNIFVIDPAFTLPLLVTVLWVLFLKRGSKKRRKINRIGLIIAWSYMLLTFANKALINSIIKEQLHSRSIEFIRYETKPAPLQNILWSVTAETEEGFYIGYYSHLDTGTDTYYYFSKNHELLNPVRYDRNINRLLRMTKGYYAVEEKPEGLLINDLRFGQNKGWYTNTGNFIFSYFVKETDEGRVLIEQQRNTFENAGESMKMLWERIKGI